MHLRALAAAAAAVTALSLATAGTAQAQPQSSTACGSSGVGESMAYNSNGMVAGWISQFYDSCTLYTYGRWDWNQDFMAAHPNRTVSFGVGSVSVNAARPNFGLAMNSTPGNAVFGVFGEDHRDAGDNTWRAGAELDSSGCVAWTSAHNYNNGTESAGPYAGCNDWLMTQIPWTAP
ncbi:hypothetical protein ABTZ03_39045 [Kitasatospora sp. NPDC096077]|uniref:hypothetical protein n=1 Tax=Kitasatospora sp. NPDC096077 TaxID=3155544 RepID=UPI0033275B1D